MRPPVPDAFVTRTGDCVVTSNLIQEATVAPLKENRMKVLSLNQIIASIFHSKKPEVAPLPVVVAPPVNYVAESTPPVSEAIRGRLQASGQQFFGNDNISNVIAPGEIEELVDEVTTKFQSVLDALVIDTANDHNSQDTARRWAKMMVKELFSGRYQDGPAITVFPNVQQVDEMYVVGPIMLRSVCAHHLAPIMGQAWVGVVPGGELIGLSKFHRTIQHIAARPQIQEELTTQIADALEELTSPQGIAVLIKASHMCCTQRGVKDKDSLMVTSVTRGAMRTDAATRAEFFKLVQLTSE